MVTEQIQSLLKALEAGSYNAAPGTLTQGAALQIEDLSNVMHNLTFEDKHLVLQKMLATKNAKGQLVQFDRQLSYGIFGGSAQYEGGVGEEETSAYARIVVPMSYYSHTRRVTVAANMVQAFDGVKAEERAADDATKKVAGDIEFDTFRGQDDFSNAGIFDGNPAAIALVPNMIGLGAEVRQADTYSAAQDLMFAEYGADQSCVLPVNGNLSQSAIEDGTVRSAMNEGAADHLCLDPISLSAYNKIAYAKERYVLGARPLDATGAELRTQWTSSSYVTLLPSRFLAGKTRPAISRPGSPAAPVISGAAAAGTTSLVAGDYIYYVTAVNERGESPKSLNNTETVAAGEQVTITITNVAAAKYYNVYRTNADAPAATAKFIGRVKAAAGASTLFLDLGNKTPGFVTGYLIEKDTMAQHQLAPYSRLKLAVSDLSLPEAHFRFTCLAVYKPRRNVLLDNLNGQTAL